jgi:hypothetical protein
MQFGIDRCIVGPDVPSWAIDFIVDGLATGRMVRILSVVDGYTGECPALEADTRLGSGRVARMPERLIEERGRGLGQRPGVHLAQDAGLVGGHRSVWFTFSRTGQCRTPRGELSRQTAG